MCVCGGGRGVSQWVKLSTANQWMLMASHAGVTHTTPSPYSERVRLRRVECGLAALLVFRVFAAQGQAAAKWGKACDLCAYKWMHG